MWWNSWRVWPNFRDTKREQSEDTVERNDCVFRMNIRNYGNIWNIYIYIYGIWLKNLDLLRWKLPGPSVVMVDRHVEFARILYKKWGGDQEDGVRLSVNLCCFKFLAIDLHRITNYFPSFCMFLLSPSSVVVVVVAMYATCFLKCSCISQFDKDTQCICASKIYLTNLFLPESCGCCGSQWEGHFPDTT